MVLGQKQLQLRLWWVLRQGLLQLLLWRVLRQEVLQQGLWPWLQLRQGGGGIAGAVASAKAKVAGVEAATEAWRSSRWG